jgi:hypothetical protein
MATNENEGPTAGIVGKKTFGSVDFRQSWRTRLLFYRDVITKAPCTGRDCPPRDCGDGVLMEY